MFANRPEFHICDLAVMMVGGTPFSIYNTYAPEQIEYVVSDAGARILIDRAGRTCRRCSRRARTCRTSST